MARGQLTIDDGRISDVQLGATKAADVDVGDAYLIPGAIDCHAHSGSYAGEGLAAMTASAAAGGVTTVVDMPYDALGPVTTPAVLQEKFARVGREALVDVALLATIDPERDASDVGTLVENGACGFKLSIFGTDQRRFPRIPDLLLLEVLDAIRRTGSVACIHAENEEIIKPLTDRLRSQGHNAPLDHCRSRPPVSEYQAVLTALEYARSVGGARLHLCHLSLPRSVDLAQSYHQAGLPVTVETCPHYLVFSETDMEILGGRVKINPPVRAAEEVHGLWERLLAGSVDVVASDHAPWPLEQKVDPDIFANHSGAPGVETLLPLMADAVFGSHDLGVAALVRLLSTNPAGIFGLDDRKGALRVGADADIVALDPSGTWTIDESQLHSNAGWSPYHGRTLRGRVLVTVSRGKVVWDGRRVTGSPGDGLPLRPYPSTVTAYGEPSGFRSGR